MNNYEGFETLRNSVLFNTEDNGGIDVWETGTASNVFQSNASTPVPLPTPIPISLQIDVTQIITSVVSAYRDVAINAEIEKTKREQARQLAKIEIARMREDTERYEMFLNDRKEVRKEFIRLISDVLQKPHVDGEVVTYLKMVLEFLLIDGQNAAYCNWSGLNQ